MIHRVPHSEPRGQGDRAGTVRMAPSERSLPIRTAHDKASSPFWAFSKAVYSQDLSKVIATMHIYYRGPASRRMPAECLHGAPPQPGPLPGLRDKPPRARNPDFESCRQLDRRSNLTIGDLHLYLPNPPEQHTGKLLQAFLGPLTFSERAPLRPARRTRSKHRCLCRWFLGPAGPCPAIGVSVAQSTRRLWLTKQLRWTRHGRRP